jgi:hypothetical protein
MRVAECERERLWTHWVLAKQESEVGRWLVSCCDHHYHGEKLSGPTDFTLTAVYPLSQLSSSFNQEDSPPSVTDVVGFARPKDQSNGPQLSPLGDGMLTKVIGKCSLDFPA